MLELLNRADQSKEHSAVMHLTSTGYIPISQTPEEESSDGIGGCLQKNQSSAAQGFGLQLAPPLQTKPGLNHFSSNSSQRGNYSSSTQATGVRGDQGQRMLDSTALGQSLPSHEVGEGEFKTTRSVPGQIAIGSSWHTRQAEFSSESTHIVNESFRKEPGFQQLHGGSSLNPPSNQRDIEAFGRTLKPNNFVQQNYSLTNQIRAVKGVATDPSNRGPKRQKGSKSILLSEQVASRSGQPYEADAVVEDALLSSTSILSEDPKMHDFSEQEDSGAINKSENFQHGSTAAFIRTEHLDISPQMAASCFNQNGSFKDGQMLQMHDAHKAITLKASEPPFKQSLNSLHVESLEHMNVAGDRSEIKNKHPNENSLAIENFPLLQSLPPDKACEHIVVSRPKKRKFAKFEFQSWQKEVSHSCEDFPSLRWFGNCNCFLDFLSTQYLYICIIIYIIWCSLFFFI